MGEPDLIEFSIIPICGAILAVIGVDKVINISSVVNTGTIGGIIIMLVMIALVYFTALKAKKVDK